MAIIFIILSIKKFKFYAIYKFITINFFTVWYFLLVIIFTFLTIYFYENINFDKINLLTIISCVLIGLLILPFFKKVVAFGVEAEIELMQRSSDFNIVEQVNKNNNTPLSSEDKKEREEYLQNLENLKKEFKDK